MAPKRVLLKADPKLRVLNERMKSDFPFQFKVRKSVGLIFFIMHRPEWPLLPKESKEMSSNTAVESQVRYQQRIPNLRAANQWNRFQNRLWNFLPWRQLKIARLPSVLVGCSPSKRQVTVRNPPSLKGVCRWGKRKEATVHLGTGKSAGSWDFLGKGSLVL